MKNTFLVLALIAFSQGIILAQAHIDVVKIEHMLSPDEGLFRQNDESLDYIRSRVDFALPISIKDHYLVFNPGYEYQQLQYSQSDKIFLNNLYFPISFQYQWKNEKWKTSVSYVPRVIGDLDDSGSLQEDYFQHGAAILFYYQRNENLQWKFGAYVNDEFFGIFVLPLLGIDWKISETVNIYGVLPRRLFLNRKLGQNSNYGLAFKARTNSFRYLKSDKNAFFDIRENQILLYGTTRLVADLTILAEVGHTIFRRSKFEVGDTEIYKDVNDGYIFRVGIAYRVDID